MKTMNAQQILAVSGGERQQATLGEIGGALGGVLFANFIKADRTALLPLMLFGVVIGHILEETYITS